MIFRVTDILIVYTIPGWVRAMVQVYLASYLNTYYVTEFCWGTQFLPSGWGKEKGKKSTKLKALNSNITLTFLFTRWGTYPMSCYIHQWNIMQPLRRGSPLYTDKNMQNTWSMYQKVSYNIVHVAYDHLRKNMCIMNTGLNICIDYVWKDIQETVSSGCL